MMRVACCLVVLAILLVAVTVAASDAPMPTGDQPVLFKDDLRLQAKVTLKLKCEPLSLFVDSLSKSTSVTIRVRKDIADKNVTVCTEDMPCGEAMTRMAQVLGYVWEYTGDTIQKRGYVLVRPLKRKKEAEDLRQAEWKQKDQQFKDGIENAIKMIDADASAWQKAFDKNPAQAVEDYGDRRFLRGLACFTKAQRDDLWERIAASQLGKVQIPFAQLPPSLQKIWKDETTKLHANDPDQYPSPDGLDQSYLAISCLGGSRTLLGGLPPSILIARMSRYAVGGVWRSCEKDSLFWDGDLQGLRTVGVDTSSYKAPTQDYSAPGSKSKRVQIKFHDDKTKQREGSLHTLAEILEAASAMFDVSIFADDYLCRHKNGTSPLTTFPDNLDEALGELEREFDYKAAFKGKSIGLRCETWYKDEPYEAPKRLVLQWTAIKKQQKRLEPKDYLDIVRKLDNMQIYGLRAALIDGDWPLLWETLRMSQRIDQLRLYSTLSSGQIEAAAEGGLCYADMNPSQQQAFVALLLDARPDLPDDKLGDCLFRVRQDSEIQQGVSDDEEGKPYKFRRDWLIFTYIFGPGDEKQYKMILGSEDLPLEPAASQAK